MTTGTRNSSVKEDAVDAVLALVADRDLAGNVSNPRLALRKVRGAPTGQEIPFSMRTVTVYENAGYDAVTTLVVAWSEQASAAAPGQPQSTKAKRWPKSLVIFKKALDYALASSGKRLRPFADGPEVLAVVREAVRQEFMKSYPAEDNQTKGKAFRRSEQTAIAAELMAAREVATGGEERTLFWTLTADQMDTRADRTGAF